MIKRIVMRTENVLPSLSVVSSVVNAKNAIPILSNVFLHTYKDESYECPYRMNIMGSDGDMWVRKNVPVENDSDIDVMICVNAKSLVQGLGNLNDTVVSMNVDSDNMVVTCKYGTGYFTLPYVSADTYPRCMSAEGGEVSQMTINAKNLYEAIKRVEFAVVEDALRPVLGGVHFDFTSDCMIAVATDTRRMAKYIDKTIKTDTDEAHKFFTLPKKPCKMMTTLLQECEGEVHVLLNSAFAIFEHESFHLSTRLLEGNYPNYNSVIPSGNDTRIIMKKDALLDAIRRLSPMANIAVGLVLMNFSKGKLVMSCEDQDYGKAAEENMTCDFDGEHARIGFSVNFLSSVIGSINGDYVVMNMKNESCPALFCESVPHDEYNYQLVLMPVRIVID